MLPRFGQTVASARTMHSGPAKIKHEGQIKYEDDQNLTWRAVTVSTMSTPPILLIRGPQRDTTLAISWRWVTPPPSIILIRSTMADTTDSRTRERGTLLAIRSVLSSTAALSTECPSANALSSDSLTSFLNSDSAMASVEESFGSRDKDVADEVGRLSTCLSKSLSSSEDSLSSPDDSEPGSEKAKSEALSPEWKQLELSCDACVTRT